jgi:hypothetical protein
MCRSEVSGENFGSTIFLPACVYLWRESWNGFAAKVDVGKSGWPLGRNMSGMRFCSINTWFMQELQNMFQRLVKKTVATSKLMS